MKYTSDNEKVAVVDENGRVTAKSRNCFDYCECRWLSEHVQDCCKETNI
ncbi:MAG: Ig-like domain-containing protein [Clostridium sp.]